MMKKLVLCAAFAAFAVSLIGADFYVCQATGKKKASSTVSDKNQTSFTLEISGN